MVNPNYTVVGLGVLTLGSQTWVVEDFVRPLGGDVPTPPPMLSPETEADAAPAPARARTTTPPTTAAQAATVRTAAPPAPPATVLAAAPAAPEPSEWLSTVLDGLSLLDRLSV